MSESEETQSLVLQQILAAVLYETGPVVITRELAGKDWDNWGIEIEETKDGELALMLVERKEETDD